MKIYKCKCGKEFTNPNGFNGHKASCKIHLGDKYDLNRKMKTVSSKKGGKTTSEKWKKIREEKLEQWIKEKHKCETCGKIMTVKIRSGRFCSKSCAAAYGRLKKQKYLEGNFECKYCNNKFKTKAALSTHSYFKHPEYGTKLDSLVKVKIDNKIINVNITKRELLIYRENHTKCEICGKPLEEIKNDKTKINQLTVDHDHKTNNFRGLLCSSCNRHLGWYDKNREDIIRYLKIS